MLLCAMLNAGEDMKIITEEDAILARNALLKKGNNLGACAIDMLISDHAKEIDTLTVSKLRPMVDAPIREVVLLKSKSKKINHLVQQVVTENTRYLWVGWLPMPIYKPEKE